MRRDKNQGFLDFNPKPAPPPPLTTTPVLGPRAAAASEAGRDAGIDQVAENNSDFIDAGLAFIARLGSERAEATGEDIRFLLEQRGVHPHDPHAWGALTNIALGRGLLEATGEWRPMRAPKSNARKTPVYTLKGG